MPLGSADFREMLAGFPGLRALPREKLAKAVYLRDRRALPEEMKRLFDGVNIVRIPVREPEDVSRAIQVANGEIAGIYLGLKADALHYMRRRLAITKDREISVSWGPKEDVFDGEILPQLDGFELDLSDLKGVEIDGEHGIVRCGVGARWNEVFEACKSKGWLFPLFPTLPLNHYIGDIVDGTASLISYRGDAARCVRNIDFLTPDARYGESGFDRVPNSAAGYDLNSLLLIMGRHVSIPVSVTFTLVPCVEGTKTLRYGLESTEHLLGALEEMVRTRLQPLKVVFGDGVASRVAFGREEGPTMEVSLHGTEETLPPQEEIVDSLFKENVEKKEIDGLAHPLQGPPRRVPPSPLAELRSSLADLAPLLNALTSWREAQGDSFGVIGTLFESGTIGLLPFIDRATNRGERFDRLLELVQIARAHRCRLRGNTTLQLLSPESNLEKRFALVRRIKEEVDLPNVVNPSGLLWVPQGL
ncbi:MAG: FAD-binding protein [Thermoplasmata archaeon]